MANRTGSPFDKDMATVLRRPGPAIASLLAGAVIGVTGGAALAGGGDPPPPTTPVAQAPERTTPGGKDATPTPKPEDEADPSPTPKPPKPKRELGFEAARDSVERFVAGKSIGVALAPLGGGGPLTAGEDRDFVGWSTLKIPVIATFLAMQPTPTQADQAAIRDSIVQSDNIAVRSLYKQLLGQPPNVDGAEEALQSVLARGEASVAGMPRQVDPELDNSVAFGTASWSPKEAARFFRALACGDVAQPEHAALILGHMKGVQGQGRFGAMNVFPNVASKGGWNGPVVSQIAIVGGDANTGFVLAVMTESSGFESGAALVRQVAQKVKASVKAPGGDPANAAC